MSNLATELEPPVPQDEIDAAVKEAEAQPKEEQPADGGEQQQEEPKSEKPPKGFVPHSALHEERARRKELQRMNEELQAAQARQMAVMEQRFSQIQAAMQQSRQQVPTFEEDPVNALKHGVEATQAEIAQMRAWQAQEFQRQQAEQQHSAFLRQLESRVAEDIKEFVEETPDYLDAIQDLRVRRAKQHMALGATEQQAVQMVMQEEYQLAAAALQNGRSPAKAAYEIALAYGYTKKEAKEAADSAQKMEALQKGVKAQSLGSGGAPNKGVSAEALLQMSDEDFAAFMKSGGWNKLG